MKLEEFRCTGCGNKFEGINYPPCPNCGPIDELQLIKSGSWKGVVVRVGSTSEDYHWWMRDDVCMECDSIQNDVYHYVGPASVEPAFWFNHKGDLEDVNFPRKIIKACGKCAERLNLFGWEKNKIGSDGKLIPLVQE